MSIADSLYPEWDNLLVVPDKVPDDLGIQGINGEMMVAAEKYKGRPKSGVVIAAGPTAPYPCGARVLFDSHSTTDLGQDGSSERVLLLNSQQVRCWTDGGEDMNDLLGESWRDHIKPPPGCIIVERAQMPTTRGAIWVPDTFNAATRSSEATVLASDDKQGPNEEVVNPGGRTFRLVPTNKFAKDDRVFLAGTTAKHIMLGRRGDVVLWIIRPGEITGRLLDDPGAIRTQAHIAESDIAHLNELSDTYFGVEEGETRGPR